MEVGIILLLAVFALAVWAIAKDQKQLRRHEAPKPIPLPEEPEEPDPPKGVQGLAQHLVQRREYAQSKEREEHQRRARLVSNWELISGEAARRSSC